MFNIFKNKSMEIIVKTQADLDKIKTDERVEIRITGGVWGNRIVISKNYYYRVVAWENSNVVAWGNSNVVAWENSNVVARENSNVVAWGNSNVVARGNSNVVARENSNVVAWENSNVVAWGNSNVVARENSNVVARENSNVVAWGNSNVVAWGNSNVVAWGNSGIHLFSDFATIVLWSFSVCWKLANGKVVKKSKDATVIKPKVKKGLLAWLEREGIQDDKEVILFKKVSFDFKTQENTKNETLWKIDTEVIHHDWQPGNQECGENKFHACSRPYFCDEFRSEPGDRYIAISISKKDLHVWEDNPMYPHKVAFRSGKVLHEVNKMGKKIQ